MSLTPQEIREIVLALQESEWDQAVVTVGDVRIALGRNGATPDIASPAATQSSAQTLQTPAARSVSAVSSEQTPEPSPLSDTSIAAGHVVTAPSVGVFWAAPQPGKPAFVEIGSEVEAGDTLCIVEVMKLMNNVTADVAGTVVAVHQENAAHVEYGTALFTIAPRRA